MLSRSLAGIDQTHSKNIVTVQKDVSLATLLTLVTSNDRTLSMCWNGGTTTEFQSLIAIATAATSHYVVSFKYICLIKIVFDTTFIFIVSYRFLLLNSVDFCVKMWKSKRQSVSELDIVD